MKDKLIIKFEQWDHTCGDGCCYDYGVDMFINEEKVTQNAESYTQITEAILKYLNVEFEIR